MNFLLHPTIAPWVVPDPTGIRLRLLVATAAGQPEQVLIRCEPDNEETFIPMLQIGEEGRYVTYEARLGWDPGNVTTLYAFKVLVGGRQLWLAADGEHAFLPPRDVHFRLCEKHQPPAWVRDQIFYQIFPDRFAQGNPANAVRSNEYSYDDGSQPVTAKAWGEPVDMKLGATAFYGGDLPGITARLDYLQQRLGVTALYLNPIFTSGSNHKYDAEDYYNVDPHLGGNGAFAELRGALRERGMKLVLDAVLNHCSDNHPWFNRWNRHPQPGAWQGAQPYAGWFGKERNGEFTCWKGFSHLRVFDFAVPAVRQAMYEAPDSVLRHWLKPPHAIDGWRFDVIHMLGEGSGATNNAHYAREFRRAMKEESPDSYFLGEQFSEATRWLQGEQQDGAMNYYGFAHPVRAWLGDIDINLHPTHITTQDFARWLDGARARIPYANQLVQFNLLGSHDTPRFLTLVKGDRGRMRIAMALQLVYPGTPSIYYGDEIGTEGWVDPDCRRCFDWNEAHWDQTLFEHYRALIALRKARPELRAGAFISLHAQGDVYVCARYLDGQVTLMAANRGDAPAEHQPDLAALPVVVRQWLPVTLPGSAAAAQPETAAAPAQLSLAPRSVQVWTGAA